MYDILEHTTQFLPADKARYLMGVGTPDCLVEGVARGIDMFDCVFPTRVARNGMAMVHRGRMNMRNQKFERDFTPLEEGCGCYACTHFTRLIFIICIRPGNCLPTGSCRFIICISFCSL